MTAQVFPTFFVDDTLSPLHYVCTRHLLINTQCFWKNIVQLFFPEMSGFDKPPVRDSLFLSMCIRHLLISILLVLENIVQF